MPAEEGGRLSFQFAAFCQSVLVAPSHVKGASESTWILMESGAEAFLLSVTGISNEYKPVVRFCTEGLGIVESEKRCDAGPEIFLL